MYIDKALLPPFFTIIAVLIVVLICYIIAQTSAHWAAHRPLKKKKSRRKRSRYISSDVKKRVWERDGGRCVICGSTVDLEYDHDIPFSKGGSNSADNIRLLCRHCNRSKSARIE
jgi:5-methylcytosine-specific restriction endonuclease McrA